MALAFYGDVHGQGRDAFEFFTNKTVIIERWPKEWSRSSEMCGRTTGLPEPAIGEEA